MKETIFYKRDLYLNLASLLMVYTIAHNLTQVIRRPLLSSSCASSLFIVCNIVHYRISKTHRMPYFHMSCSAKEPCNSWLFCCKMTCNLRNPVGLRHPAPFSVCAISLLIVCSIALCTSLLILRNIALRLRHHSTFSQCVRYRTSHELLLSLCVASHTSLFFSICAISRLDCDITPTSHSV